MKNRVIYIALAICLFTGIVGCNKAKNENLSPEVVDEITEQANTEKIADASTTEKSEDEVKDVEEDTSMNELPPEYASAYADVLQKLYDEQTLPDGTKFEFFPSIYDIEENYFAVADVDGDGVQELDFIWGTDCMAAMTEYVFKYDKESDSIIQEIVEFPGMQFYTDGMIIVGWSHNQGFGEMWPYNIYEYDAEKTEYKFVGYVEGWNKEIGETDYEGNTFPADIDTDNLGVVYRIKYGDEYNEEYYSQSDYDAFYEKLVANKKKLDINYYRFSSFFIEKLRDGEINPVIKGKIVHPEKRDYEYREDPDGMYVDEKEILNIKDGIYAIELSSQYPISGYDEEKYIYAHICEKETYDIVDMNTLEVGDGIECDGYVTKIESLDNKDGGILINGGINEGGLDFVARDEDNCYVFKGFDDIATYNKVGYCDIALADECVIMDYTDLNNQDGIKVSVDEFNDYAEKNSLSMNMYNTRVTVENGKATEIDIYYMP